MNKTASECPRSCRSLQLGSGNSGLRKQNQYYILEENSASSSKVQEIADAMKVIFDLSYEAAERYEKTNLRSLDRI